MKREGFLFEKVVDIENIKKAILKAASKKTSRNNVKRILLDKNYYAEKIREMLINNEYVPSPYKCQTIQDGVRKKEREIFKPKFFPDQIVHWAIMIQLEPILKRGMYELCCASVKNRGIKRAKQYIENKLVTNRKDTKYCLQLDIKKFYPNIDKDILKKKFRKVIKDKKMLNLLDSIVDSVESGLPIRKFYFTMVRELLFTGFRPLYKRRIKNSNICKIYG